MGAKLWELSSHSFWDNGIKSRANTFIVLRLASTSEGASIPTGEVNLAERSELF